MVWESSARGCFKTGCGMGVPKEFRDEERLWCLYAGPLLRLVEVPLWFIDQIVTLLYFTRAPLIDEK